MKKTIWLSLGLVVAGSVEQAMSCTTIIVGSKATSDGSIIIARNDDHTDAHDPHNMMSHLPQRDSYVFHSNTFGNATITNRFECTIPANASGYTAFPDWESLTKPMRLDAKLQPSKEEIGTNDHNVSISATESLTNSKAVLTIDPYIVGGGVTEDAIPSIIMPQASSAREGIALLGQYIEEYGAGEGFGVAISDEHEVWYLETASGHHWLAQRVPDVTYFVSGNQGRFQEIDFNDEANVQSSDVRSFLINNGLYNPSEPFNFFKLCMENSDNDKAYNYTRVRRLQSLYSGTSPDNNDGTFPAFGVPKKKLSIADVAAGLRDHYDGSSHDPYLNKNPKETWRPISVLRTSISHITSTRAWLPDDLATVTYIAQGMADLSTYIPLYHGLPDVPPEYQGANDAADDDSLFWQCRKLQVLVMTDYPTFAPRVKAAIAAFEKEIQIQQEAMEKAYLEVYIHNRTQGRDMITRFTDQMREKHRDMVSTLIVEIAKETDLEHMTNAQYTELLAHIQDEYHFEGL